MSFSRSFVNTARSRSFIAATSIKSAFFPSQSLPLSVRLLQGQQARYLSEAARSAIDNAVKSSPVVLFMKGTPEFPQCGFSRATIQILGLQGLDPEKFAAFNVLEDDELRSGIKEYSNWPTIPQLYVNGEFIGGCDILIAMHQSGELGELLEDAKVLVPEEESAEPEAK
ncbi:thioredoxin-like protein [Kockiozyma suomiensis]|uniref:thioredoxin-like protein n=1 Tax=Kockiozyma suomiensis TaxID=1337062 RepID=UPI003343464F